MKQQIISANKKLEPVVNNQSCHHAPFHTAKAMDEYSIHWLAYSYPFMPMVDFSFLVDAIKKIAKRWVLNKSRHPSMYKKAANETV